MHTIGYGVFSERISVTIPTPHSSGYQLSDPQPTWTAQDLREILSFNMRALPIRALPALWGSVCSYAKGLYNLAAWAIKSETRPQSFPDTTGVQLLELLEMTPQDFRKSSDGM